MAWVGPCGHVRDSNLAIPCATCERIKREREWEKQHPNYDEYLKEKGWRQVFLEGEKAPLGWWHSDFGPRFFDFLVAVREQRNRDTRPQPRFRKNAAK